MATRHHLPSGHPVEFLKAREQTSLSGKWEPVIDYKIETNKNMYRKNLFAHYGCVNAVEFSADGRYLVSGGDDRRILLWKMGQTLAGKGEPSVLQAEHSSNVFAIAVSSSNTRIYSGGNDDQVILHDMTTGAPVDFFLHEQPVYGITIDPYNDNIFSSACDDGRLLLYDTRESCILEPFCIANTTSAFHSIQFHPTEPRMILSGNSKEGVTLWDVRKPNTPLIRYGGLNTEQCCMSAKFNHNGSKILALRRRLPPVLYSLNETNHELQFHHEGYYNSCTMKSCCFAGSKDQFILSGSDSFDVYLWKIPENTTSRWVENAQMVLRGHRSIVNQVRYNKPYGVIVSSGVEKVIKLWSPMPLSSGKSNGDGLNGLYEKKRKIFSNTEYLDLITLSGQLLPLTYDTARKSTKEDPRMMAFFDALVQRDIQGLSSDEEEVPKNNYTAISPPQSNNENDSDTSENESVPERNRAMLISHIEGEDASRTRASISHEAEQDRAANFEDGDESISFGDEDFRRVLHSTFINETLPATDSPRQSTRLGAADTESLLKVPDDSNMASIVDPEANVIKDLIAKKQIRLKQLAQDHAAMETFSKKSSRKRRNYRRRSASSSEDEGESRESHETKKRQSQLEKPETESSASGSARLINYQTAHKRDSYKTFLKKRNRTLKEMGDEYKSMKTLKRACKRLRYDPDLGNRRSSSKSRSRSLSPAKSNCQKKERNGSRSSRSKSPVPRDKSQSPQPGPSSGIRHGARKMNMSHRSSSSSSSTSSSTGPPSSSSDISTSDEGLVAYFDQIKKSKSYKLSPVIRRIEYMRLRKLRRLRKALRDRERVMPTRAVETSGSPSSSSSDSDTESSSSDSEQSQPEENAQAGADNANNERNPTSTSEQG